MIALTKEKREELIKECEFDIERLTSLTTKFPEEIALQNVLLRQKIALASLTIEAKHWIIHVLGGDQFAKDGDYVAKAEGDGMRTTPLFTAPPVPEIKLPPELLDLVNAVEFYHAVKAENPDTETGMWRDAYDWIKKTAVEAAPVIKRLNGLGE